MFDESLKDANILIVDDQEANIEMLADFLQLQGFTSIKTTTDPREVMSLFQNFEPDLILLDLMMPFKSGFDVLHELKILIPAGSFLPVLVLTANITVEAKQNALAAGASDFLSKPFDLVEIGLRIKNLLYTRYLLQKLQNKNQELEAFTHSISHELRAPLRHIKGFIDILTDMGVPRSEEERHFLNVISESAVEMGKLIEALLAFSRINRTELRKSTINSTQMVNQVLAFFQPDIQNRTIKFNIGQLINCTGDEQLIRQVWTNLISNAIKYTSKVSKANIEIGSSVKGRNITFFIRDNGTGFDMQYAEKLFGVFKRLHKANDFEGIGVGLAIVNSIVTRHGGICSAIGERGKGATFTFSLPA
jgi:signal transduction histidine kinase